MEPSTIARNESIEPSLPPQLVREASVQAGVEHPCRPACDSTRRSCRRVIHHHPCLHWRIRLASPHRLAHRLRRRARAGTAHSGVRALPSARSTIPCASPQRSRSTSRAATSRPRRRSRSPARSRRRTPAIASCSSARSASTATAGVPVDAGFVRADGQLHDRPPLPPAGDRTLRTLLLPNRKRCAAPRRRSRSPSSSCRSQASRSARAPTPVDFGQSVTIAGTLTGGPNTSVTLFSRNELGGRLHPIATGTTDATGAYAFTQSPPRNTVYQVRVTSDPQHRTARLFQGVRDVVSLAASTDTATVGDVVTFSGTVQPNKSGHAILLLRLDAGIWRTVAVRTRRRRFEPTRSRSRSPRRAPRSTAPSSPVVPSTSGVSRRPCRSR